MNEAPPPSDEPTGRPESSPLDGEGVGEEGVSTELPVSVEHLHVQYGGHRALEDVSFSVDRSDFLAVIGPNGSGKTTLIKTLLGLVDPSRGAVSVFGHPPGNADPERIGYVPQIKALDRQYPARSIELVLTGIRRKWPGRSRPEDRDRALATLDRVGARHLAERPLGSLSGGELQRVYLARSLIRRPALILLDEPGTGVDAAGAADLYDLLESYQHEEDATLVMVTHDLSVALHHASRVLVLDRAQVSFGTPEEALTEPVLREAFGHVGHPHVMRPDEASS